MEEAHRKSAEWIRSLISNGSAAPPVVRTALMNVPPPARDAWLDLILGLDEIPDDGPELPRGCVPYLPCPVDAVLRAVEYADVQASDMFVDVGAGVGRAVALVHILTGAATLGIEIQPELVLAARRLTTRVPGLRLSMIEGDASRMARFIALGSIFFFYCPFSGGRLEKILDDLEPIARNKEIRICCVDLPLPPRVWLTLVSPPSGDLEVYRSTLLDNSRPSASQPA